MPRRATHLLRWLPVEQRYSIESDHGTPEPDIVPGSRGWYDWLDTIPSFAFESQWGEHCTVRKERLQRGDAYWYAYRSIEGRTKKRYLGRTADLTLERLEEISSLFATEEKEARHHLPDARLRSVSRQQQGQMSANNGNVSVLTPILATKLHPPRLSASLVERSRLLTLLDNGRRQKLTLLQAPAGFGKTTLVTQWIAHRQAQATTSSTAQSLSLPVAWVSLDRGDNDPVRFWSSLVTACQNFHEQVGQTALVHLSQTPQLPFAPSPLETTITLLLNDLAHFVQEGVLVLEDYHLIEQERIHETLAFFIEHLPACLQVVMLTRSEPPLPLVRWRARGDVLEVPSAQLRFSVEETAAFLQQIVPQTLSHEAVYSLHSHLEGWAAGLRLLALSFQGQVASQAVEKYLTQLNNGGPATHAQRPIQEYFLSEVFSTLPGELQLFLLQTSILSRLSSSLCDAVTGRQDSAIWLEQAERSGFFLEALDNAGTWYRYHALFAETMRAEASRRLGEDALRHLSAIASHWYEEHDMLMEAIEAALYAQEAERAAYLIEGLNESFYFSEYHTMLRWLEQLPEPLLRVHPALCFCYAQALYVAEESDVARLKMEQIEALLQMAEEEWRRQGEMEQVGILYAFRTTLAMILGHNSIAASYARQALEYAPLAKPADGQRQKERATSIDWRSGSLVALGTEATQEGYFDKAHQHLLEAYTVSLKNTDRTFPYIIRRLLGEACIELGELHQAAEYFQQQMRSDSQRQLERGEDMIHAFAACGLARLYYEWNELAKAEQLACEVIEYRYSGYLPLWEEEARAVGELMKLIVQCARGETAPAQQLSALFVRLQASPFPNVRHLIPNVLDLQARLQIKNGDLSAARRTLSTLTSSESELSVVQKQGTQLIRARLLLAQGEAGAALHLLERLLITALVGKHIIRALEIQLLIALAYAADKQVERARQRLSEVLAQARNEGFLRLFLDEGEPIAALLRSLLPSLTQKPLRAYAETILRAFSAPHTSQAESQLIEPLSAQEQRVLALLVAGRSNPEIAETLIVSVNTVKGHVKNLYRKLGVNNRVQAGEIARREKLI